MVRHSPAQPVCHDSEAGCKHTAPALVKNICQIIRAVEWFDSGPLDVYPFLVGIFDFMSSFQVMQLLAHRCLKPTNVDPLQGANLAYQALEIIYHYIPGPGIQHCARDTLALCRYEITGRSKPIQPHYEFCCACCRLVLASTPVWPTLQ